MSETLKGLCDEFWRKVLDTYIFYLDAFKGFECLREDILKKQEQLIEEQRKRDPRFATVEYMESNTVIPYIKEFDKPQEWQGLLRTNLGEFKGRNAEEGHNFVLLGNVSLITIFAWWEDKYRARIADLLHKSSKSDISVPVMGDLCRLRNAILHNNGFATEKVEGCEVLKWFKRGKRIILTFERMEQIVSEIEKGLQMLFHHSLLLGGAPDPMGPRKQQTNAAPGRQRGKNRQRPKGAIRLRRGDASHPSTRMSGRLVKGGRKRKA